MSGKIIKLAMTAGMLILVGVLGWNAFTPLPPSIQPIVKLAQVIVPIHAIEGLIGAVLILRYRQRSESLPEGIDSVLMAHLPKSTSAAVVKAGLYTFFMGAIGLSEILKGTGLLPKKANG